MPPKRQLTALVALIGCAGPAPGAVSVTAHRPPAVAFAVSACEPYRDGLPEAWASCVSTQALGLTTLADVAEVCGMTGGAEAACHGKWVENKRMAGGYSDEMLLAACAPDHDCVLRRLDLTALPDPIAQVGRCRAYGGPYEGFCVGHALDRWVATRPDVDSIARVVALAPKDHELVGQKLGLVVSCQHVGACPTDESILGRACRRSAADAGKMPEQCPKP